MSNILERLRQRRARRLASRREARRIRRRDNPNPTGGIRLEINATYRCNAVCQYCNRLVGITKISNSDVTPEQTQRMVKAVKESDVYVKHVKIAGGEPTINKELDGIAAAASDLDTREPVEIMTNDVKTVQLQTPVSWTRAPLNLPNGKSYHTPFLISPADVGATAWKRYCSSQKVCGRLFDAFGFSFCVVAGIYAHLFRKNLYSDKPVVDKQNDICQHCPYSIHETERLEMYEAVKRGDLEYPSKTFKQALRERKENPHKFDRF